MHNLRLLPLAKIVRSSSVLAAILYCSWVFGYVINPSVAWHGTASELAASGQPWHSLFVRMDIVTAAVLAFTAALMMTLVKKRIHKLVVLLYAVFAVAVFLTAVFSLQCVSIDGACDLPRYMERYAIHMTIGTCGLLSLFVGSLITMSTTKQSYIPRLAYVIVWAGGVLGIASFLLSLLLFEQSVAALVQRAFLLAASYAMWLIPHLLLKTGAAENRKTG